MASTRRNFRPGRKPLNGARRGRPSGESPVRPPRARGSILRPEPGTRSREEERRRQIEREFGPEGVPMRDGGRVPPRPPRGNTMTMVDGKFRPDNPPRPPRPTRPSSSPRRPIKRRGS